MIDRNKILKGLECHRNGFCFSCPYNDDVIETTNCKRQLVEDAIELLKEPEDRELHLADLDMLVKMIAIKAKVDGRFFSPYEVGLALVQHGQHDERFKWGEVIKYSPSEVEQILNEVINDASQNS